MVSNKRLINAGGKILLIPEIISYYHARPTLRALWQNNFANSLWVIYTAWLTRDLKSLSLRHFVPFAFIAGLIGSMVISPFAYLGKILFIAIVGSYLSLALFFSGKIALRNGLRYFPIMPLIFLTLHGSYGLGVFVGDNKGAGYCWQRGDKLLFGKQKTW